MGAMRHGVQGSAVEGRYRSSYATNAALEVCDHCAMIEPRSPLVLKPGAALAESVDLCGADQCGWS